MSTIHSTDEREEAEPAQYVTLLDWPEIRVEAGRHLDHLGDGTQVEHYYHSPTRLYLRYDGWPEELLAAGIIAAAMTVPPGKGRHYCDANGRTVRIARAWRERKEGQAQRYLSVERNLHPEELHSWPRAVEALAVCDRHLAWEHSTRAAHWQLAPPAPRLGLRLVVDNTRPEARS